MKKFSLPDMQSNSRVICTYIIDGKSYNFKFTWCDSFFVMDVYIVKPDGEKYILTGVPMVQEYDFISRIKEPDIIDGKLYLINKYGEEDSPVPENLSSDFELVYYENEKVL